MFKENAVLIGATHYTAFTHPFGYAWVSGVFYTCWALNIAAGISGEWIAQNNRGAVVEGLIIQMLVIEGEDLHGTPEGNQ
jgi:hypothetical protein